MKYVPGEGPLGAKILLLDECPHYEDVIAGKPLTGSRGRIVNRLLKDAGINRESCWVTNVCKFQVPPNPKGKRIPFGVRAKNAGIDIDEQISELQKEINTIKPNCILALGGSALWALSGKSTIQSYRGSIMWGMGRKFIPTYHPAHLLHTAGEIKGYWNKQMIDFDMKRALYQSHFPELILPQRNLKIIHSSWELAQFKNQYKDKTRVAVDIEAGGHCVPICIGLSFNKSHGVTVPLWNQDGISTIPDSDLVSCWILLSEILSECLIVGQNFNYDRDKIKRLGFSIKGLASDTLLKAFAINPELPKALAFNQSIYTEEPFYKDEGMYEGKIEDLLRGCARDACVTLEIDEAMDKDLDEIHQRDFYQNFLMKLPDMYQEIEQTGFLVNHTTRDELLHKYVTWDEKLRYEIWQLVGYEINVNSWKQVKKLFEEDMGVMMPSGTGEEEITDLLNRKTFNNPTHRKVAELILEDRRVRKTNSTYMMALPDFDGRMRTTCFPCLETGRSSNGQQDPPIRPTIDVIGEDGKKKKKSSGIAFQTITKHGDIGADVRKQFVPDKGYIFVQADSSQAEARIIARLCRDEVMVELYNTHDVHALTASWFFGGDEYKYSKKVLGYECPERFIGKANPLHTKIATPNGWKLMKDIQVGDEICNSSYGICKVTAVFPQGIKEVFKIKFSDGSEAESCKEHIWPIESVWSRNRGFYDNIQLQDLMKKNLFNIRNNPQYSVLMNNAAYMNWQPVPINPYIMGCLLGDGSFRHFISMEITEDEILLEFVKELGWEKLSNNEFTFRISSLEKSISELNLFNKYSSEKFIPDIYQFNSLENRLELLRGLMDTDGTIQVTGSGIEYSTSSELLSKNVSDLIRSLGGWVSKTERIPVYEYKGEKKEGLLSYRLFFTLEQLNPFKLSRKAERWERWNNKKHTSMHRNIVAIEKSGEFECQCISVDSNDHLYLVDDYLLTHNTLRHGGERGAKGRRAMVEVNTQARKYKVNIKIDEDQADAALRVFHERTPNIRNVYFREVTEIVQSTRVLIAPVPYGVAAKYGGRRMFFERWGDELLRMAFSYLPQRAVTDNTKGAAIRVKPRFPYAKLVMESHDSLLYMVKENEVDDFIPIITEEMERPLSFENCSLPREDLIIPSEVEIGDNFMELKKYKKKETMYA